jgi:hypothetical protein
MTVQELYNMAVAARVQDDPLYLSTIEDGKLKTYTFNDLVEVKTATSTEHGFMKLSADKKVTLRGQQ